jgi:hypothetical protein
MQHTRTISRLHLASVPCPLARPRFLLRPQLLARVLPPPLGGASLHPCFKLQTFGRRCQKPSSMRVPNAAQPWMPGCFLPGSPRCPGAAPIGEGDRHQRRLKRPMASFHTPQRSCPSWERPSGRVQREHHGPSVVTQFEIWHHSRASWKLVKSMGSKVHAFAGTTKMSHYTRIANDKV